LKQSAFQFLNRFLRTIVASAFVLSLIPAGGIIAQEAQLDLGAALLFPDDISTVGLGDYGVDTGRVISSAELAASQPELFGANQAETATAVEALDLESIHSLSLHPLSYYDGGSSMPGYVIQSSLAAFSDDEHASEAFALFEDESANDTATDLDAPPALGDESEVTEYRIEASDDTEGMPVHELEVSFRAGRVVARVYLTGYDLEADREIAEELGALLEQKLQEIINDGAPGLSLITPRYAADSFQNERTHYSIFGGAALDSTYYPWSSEQNQDAADEYGIISQYHATTTIWDGETYFGTVRAQATRFARADDAERYLNDTLEGMNGENGYISAEEIALDTSIQYGDAAIAYAYVLDQGEGNTDGVRIVVANGRYVYDVMVDGETTPDLDIAAAVMTDMLGCAEHGCATALEAPSELAAYAQPE
jgi:hypothetical protein